MRKHTTILVSILALGCVAFAANGALADSGQGAAAAMGHLDAAIAAANDAIAHGGEGHAGEVSKHAAKAIPHEGLREILREYNRLND